MSVRQYNYISISILRMMIILYYIILYSFSDNCIQPDDGQIRNGRNIQLIRYVKIANIVVIWVLCLRIIVTSCSISIYHTKCTSLSVPSRLSDQAIIVAHEGQVVAVHAMKASDRAEVQRHSFLTQAPDRE